MGTGVFFGMLVATALGVFIIPGNYTFIESLGRKRKKAGAPPPEPVEPGIDHGDPLPVQAGGGH
jgi:NADH:ubiquinone oxidoreductase subunit F (NADH-binding)